MDRRSGTALGAAPTVITRVVGEVAPGLAGRAVTGRRLQRVQCVSVRVARSRGVDCGGFSELSRAVSSRLSGADSSRVRVRQVAAGSIICSLCTQTPNPSFRISTSTILDFRLPPRLRLRLTSSSPLPTLRPSCAFRQGAANLLFLAPCPVPSRPLQTPLSFFSEDESFQGALADPHWPCLEPPPRPRSSQQLAQLCRDPSALTSSGRSVCRS